MTNNPNDSREKPARPENNEVSRQINPQRETVSEREREEEKPKRVRVINKYDRER